MDDDTANWRTRIDPHRIPHIEGELHACFFQPASDQGGTRPCVTILIPETPNDQMLRQIAGAMKRKARVMFLTDTRQQAEDVATFAATHLHRYRRVSFERH